MDRRHPRSPDRRRRARAPRSAAAHLVGTAPLHIDGRGRTRARSAARRGPAGTRHRTRRPRRLPAPQLDRGGGDLLRRWRTLGAVLVPIVHSYGPRSWASSCDNPGRGPSSRPTASGASTMPRPGRAAPLAARSGAGRRGGRDGGARTANRDRRLRCGGLGGSTPRRRRRRPRRAGGDRLHLGHHRRPQGRRSTRTAASSPRSASSPPFNPTATAPRSSARPWPMRSGCWAACCCRSTGPRRST